MMKTAHRLLMMGAFIFLLTAPRGAEAGGVRNWGLMFGTVPIISLAVGVLVASAFQDPKTPTNEIDMERKLKSVIDHELLFPKAQTATLGTDEVFHRALKDA